MDVKRRLVVPSALIWLTLFVPLAEAGPRDACAQRVIRDWYSGGRVDELYPLECYRAAIRALPNDVLEYSDADKDIARALAFARKARTSDAEQAAEVEPPPVPSTTNEAEPVEPVQPAEPAQPVEPVEPVTETRPSSAVPRKAPPAASRTPRTTPPEPSQPSRAATPAVPERVTDAAPRVATGPDPADVSAAVPYPVIVLAALAGTLLAMGAVGWLLARRR